MTGGVWVATYVLLWVTVVVLAVVVVALLRQVGVLHARLRPLGVHQAGEGLDRGDVAPPLPAVSYAGQAVTLVAFTSPTCTICRTLVPALEALDRQYAEVRLVELPLDDATRPSFAAFNVRSTPYVMAVGRDGIVLGGGVANSLEQVEVLVEEAVAGVG